MDKQRAAIKVFGFVLFLLLFAYFVFKVVQSAVKLNKEAIGTSSSIEPFKGGLFPTISLCLNDNHAPKFTTNKANQTLPVVGKADLTKSNYGHIRYYIGDEGHVVDAIHHNALYIGNWNGVITLRAYVPNRRGLFGGAYKALPRLEEGDTGRKVDFEFDFYLKRIVWSALSTDNMPCDEQRKSPDTTGCITNFLEREIGCSMKLLGSDPKVPKCSNNEQFTNYSNFGVKLLEADDNDVYKMTDCLSSCHKSTFELELSQQNKNNLEDSRDSALLLTTRYPLKRYELRKQYLVYDWNSFIADVGGYLGLLLGQSCLGMYHLMVTPSNWDTLKKYIRRNNKVPL